MKLPLLLLFFFFIALDVGLVVLVANVIFVVLLVISDPIKSLMLQLLLLSPNPCEAGVEAELGKSLLLRCPLNQISSNLMLL